MSRLLIQMFWNQLFQINFSKVFFAISSNCRFSDDQTGDQPYWRHLRRSPAISATTRRLCRSRHPFKFGAELQLANGAEVTIWCVKPLCDRHSDAWWSLVNWWRTECVCSLRIQQTLFAKKTASTPCQFVAANSAISRCRLNGSAVAPAVD